jgi:hypothetical protein
VDLGGYGSGWMLKGYKSPLQRITNSPFFAFDEHFRNQGLKNLTSILLTFFYPEDGIMSKVVTGVGAISNIF